MKHGDILGQSRTKPEEFPEGQRIGGVFSF